MTTNLTSGHSKDTHCLMEALDRLRRGKVHIKLRKCQLVYPEVEFLGRFRKMIALLTERRSAGYESSRERDRVPYLSLINNIKIVSQHVTGSCRKIFSTLVIFFLGDCAPNPLSLSLISPVAWHSPSMNPGYLPDYL